MAAKGSRIDRIVQYFKEVGIEEAKFVYQRAGEILSERQIPQTIQRKLALGGKRKRRTKAQMAEGTVTPTRNVDGTLQETKAAAAGE